MLRIFQPDSQEPFALTADEARAIAAGAKPVEMLTVVKQHVPPFWSPLEVFLLGVVCGIVFAIAVIVFK